jgi:hypothetical protein
VFLEVGCSICQALEKQCNAPSDSDSSSKAGGPLAQIAAVVLHRTGNDEALSQSLASIAKSADKIILIPSKETKADLAALKSVPGAKKLLEHSLVWEDSLSEARNAALDLAQAAGKYPLSHSVSARCHISSALTSSKALQLTGEDCMPNMEIGLHSKCCTMIIAIKSRQVMDSDNWCRALPHMAAQTAVL